MCIFKQYQQSRWSHADTNRQLVKIVEGRAAKEACHAGRAFRVGHVHTAVQLDGAEHCGVRAAAHPREHDGDR